MKTIQLTQGFVSLVDDADFERVSAYHWQADVKPNTVYAIRATRKPDGTKTTQYLHRFILGLTDRHVQVDHIDRDGLNCQRENLRVCTNHQNSHNSRSRGGASQYKGVTWDRDKQKWRARFIVSGRRKSLGYFGEEIEAALAYDAAAREHYCEFAHCNFPPKMPCVSSAPASTIEMGVTIP